MGLFTTFYTYYHRQAFQSVVRQMPASGLEQLAFTTQEFKAINWFDYQKEFEWQGRMYDVSVITRTEHGYTILCKNDTMEEMLLSLIHATKNGRQHDTKKGNPQPQFFSQESDFSSAHVLNTQSLPLSSWRSFYLSLSPQISSPPPRA